MRRMLPAMLLAGFVLGFGTPARADLYSVSGDVPVLYGFDEPTIKDASASGAIVRLTLPILVGFGVEGYKVKGKVDNAPAADEDFEYDVRMLDIYFDLDFDSVNFRLGGGVGQGTFTLTGQSDTYDSASLSQVFGTIGIPFAGVFDAHVGYQQIFGEACAKTGNKHLKLDAEMATVGIKIGF